ncbi:RAB6A-GEF complex partner protein 2 [Dissostichus eleginoides]|uniref:RAB6A-GEF complex partner protein 2 n=1 Tax=Dissostichus eleginoides TaxID=100907 RepID=A0AAD9CBQ8_DISEL|nr:RAB6A-GEF complex partner protein 2 [Dissostichus eleginoides]
MGELKESENDRGALDLRDKCLSAGGVPNISHLTHPATNQTQMRNTNTAAQKLYNRAGFVVLELFKRWSYYSQLHTVSSGRMTVVGRD